MSQTAPLVSVVVCTFNRSVALRNALESLLQQRRISHDEFEIVVVDDGSLDDTGLVVRELQGRAMSPSVTLSSPIAE